MTNNAWLLSLATLVASLPGQEPGQEPAAVRPAATPMTFRVPLAADPHEGGLWAAGTGYKASFHDGFAFYPVLGDAYPENLPWRWDTVAVRVGAQDLLSAATPLTTVNASPWRHEIRHGAATEAYDVRADGVEQTFVLHAPPAVAGDLVGDLVVEGRVTSRLRAPDVAAAHHEIVFYDGAGQAVVTYGAATAVDADGRKLPVASSFAAGTLRLTVPAAWLAGASYPVTIDPLIGRWHLLAPHAVVRTDIGHDGVSPTFGLFVGLEVAVSAHDHDVIGLLAHSDFANPVAVYSALGDSNATDPAVAYVSGAARWTFVYAFAERLSQGTIAYVHPRQAPTFGAGGAPLWIADNATRPDVGGILAPNVGGRALIVYEKYNGASHDIWARSIDPATKTVASAFVVANTPAGATYDRRRPAVNQAARTERWFVVFEQETLSSGTTRILGNLVGSNGTRETDLDLTYSGIGALAHKMRPVVAGSNGRYGVAYLGNINPDLDFGRQIVFCRVDWLTAPTGTIVRTRIPYSTVGGNGTLGGLGLAFDHESRSHWGLTHTHSYLLSRVVASRLGFSGGVVESQTLAGTSAAQSEAAGAATYDLLTDRFVMSYAGMDANHPVYVDRLGYHAGAGIVIYGTSCGGTLATPTRPDAGQEFFAVNLFGANGAIGSAALLIGGQANLPLLPIGMPGCSLYVSPTNLVVVPVPMLGTSAYAQVALPDVPVLRGDVSFQFAYVAPGANRLGVLTTSAVFVQVR